MPSRGAAIQLTATFSGDDGVTAAASAVSSAILLGQQEGRIGGDVQQEDRCWTVRGVPRPLQLPAVLLLSVGEY